MAPYFRRNFQGTGYKIASATANQPHALVLQRQGSAPCLGCSVYYAAVGHGKGPWDATGGLLKKTAFAGFVLPSAAPPLLPLFHGADVNTPTPASCEATDLQEAVTCESE